MKVPNLGIVTAHNDMLSAHQPYERYPELIRQAARRRSDGAGRRRRAGDATGGTGQTGMGYRVSRDVIALSAGVTLSHDMFDACSSASATRSCRAC